MSDVVHHVASIERRTIPSGTGVHQRNALGPALFGRPMGIRLAMVRTQFEPQGVEVVA